MSCTRCSKSHSTVQAFLLTCHDCNRKWHHRCHIPPVSDQELVSRIKALNAGDVANSLRTWRCKRCTRDCTATSESGKPAPEVPVSMVQNQFISRTSSPRGTSTLASYRPPPPPTWDAAPLARTSSKSAALNTATAPTRSASSSKKTDGEVIVVDDSESDTAPSKSTKTSTSKSRHAPVMPTTRTTTRVTKSASLSSILVHPLAQEEEESSDASPKPSLPPRRLSTSSRIQLSTSIPLPNRSITGITDDATIHSSRPRKKLASEAALRSGRTMTPTLPLTQEEKQVKREQFRRQAVETEKRRRAEHDRRKQEFIRAKSEEKEARLEQITTHVVDLTLETEQRSPSRPKDAGPSTQASLDMVTPTETEMPADIVTSPIVISTVRTTVKEPQKEPELDLVPQWIHRRKPDQDMWDRALVKKAATTPTASSRKFQAQKLGDVRPQIYYFSDIRWVEGMKRSQ